MASTLCKSSQRRAGADVDAGAVGQVPRRVAVDAEVIGRVKGARVAVGGDPVDRQALARRQGLAAQLDRRPSACCTMLAAMSRHTGSKRCMRSGAKKPSSTRR